MPKKRPAPKPAPRPEKRKTSTPSDEERRLEVAKGIGDLVRSEEARLRRPIEP